MPTKQENKKYIKKKKYSFSNVIILLFCPHFHHFDRTLLSTEFGSQNFKINKNKEKLADTVNTVDTMTALKSDIAAGCSVVHALYKYA